MFYFTALWIRPLVIRTTQQWLLLYGCRQGHCLLCHAVPLIRSLGKKYLFCLPTEIHFLLLSKSAFSLIRITDHISSPYCLLDTLESNIWPALRKYIALHSMYFHIKYIPGSFLCSWPCYLFVSYFSPTSNIYYSIS